jgi:hypothetical protein
MFVPAARSSQITMDALPVSTELTTAWARVLEGWTDGRRHDTILGVAAKHGEFAWLATRYREHVKRNADDAVAPARLARVQRAAAVVMLSKAPKAAEPMPKIFKMASLLLVGAAVAVGIGLFVVDNKVQTQQQTISQSR